MGYVSLKNKENDESKTESYSNEKMPLKCPKSYPCFVQINASLPYGGSLRLFYSSDNVQ